MARPEGGPSGGFLVAGAGGKLGRAFVRALSARGETCHAPPESELDVTDRNSLREAFERYRPRVVLNASGYTDVDRAESEPDLARRVNSLGPELLVEAAGDFSAKLVHVGTDYVFAGSKSSPYVEEDEPRPLGAYGRTKLEGERAVLRSGGPHLVVRTAWLFAPWGKSFVSWVIEAAREGRRLPLVADQTGSPTGAGDLAETVLDLLAAGASGLLHAVNSGEASWYELGVEALRLAGLRAPVEEVRSADLHRPASRPAYTVLSTERLASVLGRRPRHWRQALAECVREMLP